MTENARLAELENREAIRELIARYGPLADSGDAEGVAALWTDDGIYDVGGFGIHRGRTAISALIRSEAHSILIKGGCAHILSSPIIEIDGIRAMAVNYSMVLRREDGGWLPHRVAANRWDLVKTKAGWRVAARRNRLLDGSPDGRSILDLLAN